MSDLQRALDIFETKFGKVGNVKFLLTGGMSMDDVSAEFLALAESVANDTARMLDSYPEPDLAQ